MDKKKEENKKLKEIESKKDLPQSESKDTGEKKVEKKESGIGPFKIFFTKNHE